MSGRRNVSDHFDGKQFFNPGAEQARGFADVLRWQMHRDAPEWPRSVPLEHRSKPPLHEPDECLHVTFVGHASVLVQADGLNLLIDPVWSERASPVSWAGPKRVRQPGVAFEDLPPIAAVLLSHNHYDHLDVPTLRRLARDHHPEFVVPLGLRDLLKDKRIGAARELDWWEATQVGPLPVHSVPAQHFSARGLFDRNRTLWCGYEIETSLGNVYFAGDTGYGPHFKRIRERLGPVRFAALPIGAYLPRWFMGPVHMSPEDAAKAHEDLGSPESMAMHFGTFNLADDADGQAQAELRRALEDRSERFWIPEPGESRCYVNR